MIQTVMLAALFLSSSVFAREVQVMVGKATYHSITHSKVANILSPKIAELNAFEEAVLAVAKLCTAEKFEIIGEPEYRQSIDKTFSTFTVEALVKFQCL